MTYSPSREKSVAALFDLIGQRWTLRILWALKEGRLNFRDLRAACDDVSPTLLSQRLKSLRDAGLIEHDRSGYGFTFWGYQMLDHLHVIADWADDWAKDRDET